MPSTYKVEYLHTDALGSVRMATDQAGVVVARRDYYPFGGEIGADKNGREGVEGYTAVADARQRFTGKERDAESGLDYFLARYYSSDQGRFVAGDPIYFQAGIQADPQRWNLYAYVRGNPLTFVDPRGEEVELQGDAEERARQLSALRDAVGSAAGSYLYENKVTTRSWWGLGKETVRYIVGIRQGGPSGAGRDFAAFNDSSRYLAAVVRDENVVALDLVPRGTIITGPNGQSATIGPLEEGSGQIPAVRSTSGGRTVVSVLDPSTNPGQLPASFYVAKFRRRHDQSGHPLHA